MRINLKRLTAALLCLCLLIPAAGLAQGICGMEEFLAAFEACAGDYSLPASVWSHIGGGVYEYRMVGEDRVSAVAENDRLICVTVSVRRNQAGYTVDDAAACLDACVEAALGDADPSFLLMSGGEDKERDYCYVCVQSEFAFLCWQPLHGGRKHHANPDCCGMEAPRLITVDAAQALGFPACGKCYR